MTPEQIFEKYGQKTNERRKDSDSNADNVIPDKNSPTEIMFLSNKPSGSLNILSKSKSLPSLNIENKNKSELDTNEPFVKTLKHVHGLEDLTEKKITKKLTLSSIQYSSEADSTFKSEIKLKTKNKNRCAFSDCKIKVNPLLGTGKCPKCSNNFCGNHRLYELHDCPFYLEVKREYKLNNEKTLLKNRTQQQMIAKI